MTKKPVPKPGPVEVAIAKVRDDWHEAVKALTNEQLLEVIGKFEGDLAGAREAAEQELEEIELDDAADDDD